LFNGLSANSATLNAQPSALANTIGIGKDSGDSNWQIISRDASAVSKLDTGIAVSAGVVLDFFMYCKPNDTKVQVRLENAETGAVLLNDSNVTANLPVNTVGLFAQHHIQATAGTTAKVFSLMRMYLESED
jgi:hypothetical protein